jgi:hypothetical protein
MRGYRRDLETIDGQRRATLNGLRHARGFTDEQRQRGKETQRKQGRFGHGRFRAAMALPVGGLRVDPIGDARTEDCKRDKGI